MKQYLFIFLMTCATQLLSFTSVDPYKNIEYEELSNGLKVYILADKQAVNTQIDLRVQVGWSVETEDNAGISHLLEHLVFRDQRVPHKDYLDYLKDEGATYVNGYTGSHATNYVATIDANKSYFLVKTFAEMLFDKDVTVEDLEIEKRALQTEIGEVKWYHPLVYRISSFFKPFKDIYPDELEVFRDHFKLQKDKESENPYLYKLNNSQFSLAEVLQHYDDYYYPSNMTLKVVGNFDAKKMKTLINKLYANVNKVGKKKAEELPYDAKLLETPFKKYMSGQTDSNTAYIGARYILDDYKEYLILTSYTRYLASKMQKLLRNKLGQTYSVNYYESNLRNAALIGIKFDSLHDDFDANVALVQDEILKDTVSMDRAQIQEALHQSELYYASREHDAKTLLSLVDVQEYLHKYQNIYDKTPYEIFREIDEQGFQKTVSEVFSKKYSFTYLYRDYYVFPFDLLVLYFLFLGVVIYYASKSGRIRSINRNLNYTHRDVILTRRVSSIFVVIVLNVVLIYLTALIDSWIWYILSWLFLGDPYALESLPQLYTYVLVIADWIVFIGIYILLSLTLLKKFYSKLELTEEHLNMVGPLVKAINKESIVEIKKVSWSFERFCRTCGVSLLFFKPLVKVECENEICYLRAKNADELVEDLNKWLHN
jgi:predicted Zn-dependent peptidase